MTLLTLLMIDLSMLTLKWCDYLRKDTGYSAIHITTKNNSLIYSSKFNNNIDY